MARPIHWQAGQTRELRERAKAGEDAIDIALAMNKPVGEVRDRISRLRRAGVLQERSLEAKRADEIARLSSRMITYRLMEPFTEDEAAAWGLCADAMKGAAREWDVETALVSAVAKVDRAIGAR